ncbi:hypothetical protein [Tsukamurella sp. USMM236]|uniref:hypothetical protein n=1 Tax=Tsukamurella sp. USMM236 TaxID=3081301 RepID=UPI003017CBD8
MIDPRLRELGPSASADELEAAFFRSVVYVPLRGLNKRGAGPRDFVTRSVAKVPHVRVFLDEAQLRSTPRVGSWFERMTGRELLTLAPPGQGIELTIGDRVSRAAAGTVDDVRASAAERIRQSRTRFTSPAPRGLSPMEFRDFQDSIFAMLAVFTSTFRAAHPTAEQASIVLRFAGTAAQGRVTFVDQEGVARVEPVADDALASAARLRTGTAADSVGAWFSLYSEFDPRQSGGTFVYPRFNWDHEPHWDPEIPAVHYADELRQHPRDLRFVPDWLLLRSEEATR